jgi:hypothetical protein
MRTAEGILEEYRKGDLHNRLNLYLEYRDLRRQFMQIDSDERALLRAVPSGKKGSRILGAIGSIRYRIARCCSP